MSNEATPVEEIANSAIEIVEPEKKFIDETEGMEVGEFEKIVEDTENIEGIFVTTKKIVPMSEDEIIEKRIKDLKIKVAL